MLKNAAAEAAQFRRRALLAFLLVLGGLLVLAGWYFSLQVLQHSDYATRSEDNRIKLQPVVPGRGLIYDRKGRILADNVPAFRLEVVPEQAGDPDRWLPALQRVVALAPEDIKAFHEARRAQRGFRAIVLKPRVDAEEAARFAVDRWRFPGIELVSYLNRRYPHQALFAHVIGYVGRVDEDDLAALGESGLAFSHAGKTGLERYYEDALRGALGQQQVETNVEGRALDTVGRVPATPGADLRLSVDLDLQQAMVDAFGEAEGSAVAIDPSTGQVLAMVSLPSYDPNLFVNGISHPDYRALMDNPSRPLFNRNVLGGGPPGSTIKPMVALAGLDSGLRTPQDRVFSTGEFFIPGQRRGYRDAHGGGGWVDLRDSISRSVNYYYYDLAYDMGIDRFSDYMERYGFGARTGIDMVGENDGIVPSIDYKRGIGSEPWYPGETVIAGIGQGYWVATTLQLARATAAIANGGTLHPLRMVEARRDGYQAPWRMLPPGGTARITDHPDHLRAVQEGMMDTVHGPRGTARAMAIGAPYTMAGKTGTAQRSSRRGNRSVDPRDLPYHLRHTALFVGYAPADNPTIAVAVMVEHGGYGGSAAAPIARKVFDAWLLGTMPDVPPDTSVVDAAPADDAARAPDATVRGEATATPAASPAASDAAAPVDTPAIDDAATRDRTDSPAPPPEAR
jgi:penicillin-binding protein 2